jgi:hypothetical protein
VSPQEIEKKFQGEKRRLYRETHNLELTDNSVTGLWHVPAGQNEFVPIMDIRRMR